MAQAYKIALVLAVFVCVVNADEEKRSIKDMMFVKNFLKQYHYLSPLKNGNHDWKTALEIYQDFMHLPVTGKLDNDTFVEMHKPRCGFPDVEEDDEPGQKNTKIRKRFGISALSWDTTKLTYAFENYGKDMSQATVEAVLAKAFKVWSDSTVLTFTKISDVQSANIKIGFGSRTHLNCHIKFDGPGIVLAHAMFPTDGRIHFDEDESFTDGTPYGINLLSVAVHEIGHAIGISHNSYLRASRMHPAYKGYTPNLQLHADDINAAVYLYGGSSVSQKPVKATKCADLNGNCNMFKYMCNIPKHAAGMKSTCAETCGYCSKQLYSCINTVPESWCLLYKKLNLCTKDPSIRQNCRKTCNLSCQG